VVIIHGALLDWPAMATVCGTPKFGVAFASLLLIASTALGAQQVRIRKLRTLAERDPLTGVLNRSGWQNLVESRAATCATGLDTFVRVVDLVGLKRANQAGHGVGDALLTRAARCLSDLAGGDHLVGRLGGDEFGVLLDTAGCRSPRALATRIEAALQAATVGAVAGAAAAAGGPLADAGFAADAALTRERQRRSRESSSE
jgi:diguanylate cyclase (GGDEF)-like protein